MLTCSQKLVVRTQLLHKDFSIEPIYALFSPANNEKLGFPILFSVGHHRVRRSLLNYNRSTPSLQLFCRKVHSHCYCVDCFSIYDLNDDGYISREEMFQMLKTTMIRQPSEEDPDEGIKDLVETMIKRMVSDSWPLLGYKFEHMYSGF